MATCRADLTHRQGRHLPRAPDFLGPPNSIMCLKIYLRKGPQKEKFYVVNNLDKNSFNSQDINVNRAKFKKVAKLNSFVGAHILVLPRASDDLKTALATCCNLKHGDEESQAKTDFQLERYSDFQFENNF